MVEHFGYRIAVNNFQFTRHLGQRTAPSQEYIGAGKVFCYLYFLGSRMHGRAFFLSVQWVV